MDGNSTRMAGCRGRCASPAAIAVVILTLVIAALVACDPVHGVTIKNDTDAPLSLSGRDRPATEKFRRLAPNQEIRIIVLKSADEPVFDLFVADPEGRQLRMVLTRAELEAMGWTVIFRNEDFASSTPTAPK